MAGTYILNGRRVNSCSPVAFGLGAYQPVMNIEREKSDLRNRLGSNAASCGAALLYGACSISMSFINKFLMTSLKFDYPVFIMIIQMLFTITVLEILSIFGVISMPKYTLKRGKMFALPALFYGLNSVFSLSALSHMNIALYGVLKRCGPMVTVLISVLVLKQGWPSLRTTGSVVFLTIGCIIAGYGDLTFSVLGYTCGIISNVAQSVYLLLVQRATNGQLSTVESLQLNCINAIPLLAIICILKGEIYDVQSYDRYSESAFIIAFILVVVLGCLLNYSLFLCTSVTSALTTTIVGGLKALAQTVLGIFTFGGVSNNISTFVGLSMSICGGLSYVFVKYLENRQKRNVDLRKIMSFSTAEDLSMNTDGDAVHSTFKKV